MCVSGCATWARPSSAEETARGEGKISMTLTRQMTFWGATLAVVIVALWLLREILLPFVAGMALAYLLDPVAERLERVGVNRLVATLSIVGLFLVAFLLLIILLVPILGAQLAAFIDNLPRYVARLHELVTDPSRAWLTRIVGEGFRDADIGELVKQFFFFQAEDGIRDLIVTGVQTCALPI